MTLGERIVRLSRMGVRRTVGRVGEHLDGHSARLRTGLTRGLTVFIFHEVTEKPSPFLQANGMFATPDQFRRQVDWITSRFDVIEPTRLAQLGGSGDLPASAAMITFDDSWAGTFRTAVPMLAELDLPALCFVNMATVRGEPDLAAVRRYELHHHGGDSALQDTMTITQGDHVVEQIRERYGSSDTFHAYQGPTATPDDLARAASLGTVWFGSHLYRHWDLRLVSDELYVESLRRNGRALRDYGNVLPTFATPHGLEPGRPVFELAAAAGVKALFTGLGNQNLRADTPILDRLLVPPGPFDKREWWYATHRRRVLGSRAR
jgi:peptidoglycan/xylan/chitin deacetylase (PgdA/CDA1 family)